MINFYKNTYEYRKSLFLIVLLAASIVGCDDDPSSSSLQEISGEQLTNDGVVSGIEQTEPMNEEPASPGTGPEEPGVHLIDEEAVLAFVNESRANLGLSPLVLNDALNAAAASHSEDMNSNDYFDHTGLDGSRFWDRTEKVGYEGQPRAENIAWGQRTPEAVHDAWMNSTTGHRENILLEDITEMGLGRDGNVWTQIFGRAR